MTWVIKAFSYFILSLTLVILAEEIVFKNCARAQADLVVQPASRDITLTGYTRSQTTVTLSSEVAGRVLKINYDNGQVIGELPFLSIDPTLKLHFLTTFFHIKPAKSLNHEQLILNVPIVLYLDSDERNSPC